MCGIVGYIGRKPAQDVILSGLKKLEYRGYDSAGIATLNKSEETYRFETRVQKQAGKLKNLIQILDSRPCIGSVGIGHTRWATHGEPSDLNAHPHGAGGITIVHNGIIENYVTLRDGLIKKGCKLASSTDSEVIVHLINLACRTSKTIDEAFYKSIKKLRGAFSIVLIDEANPKKMLCAKMATPLVIGVGEKESFVASDCLALLNYTKKFIFLEDGDVAIVQANKIRITDFDEKVKRRKRTAVDWTKHQAEKSGFDHYMLKEIFEQPQAVSDTFGNRLSIHKTHVDIDGIDMRKLKGIERIVIVGCGTSYNAGLLSEYLFEKYLQIPVEVEFASEFRYRNPILNRKTLVIAISQSGETADTIGALDIARNAKAPLLGICNVVNSAIARACSKSLGVLYTRAGPEISVASTKAFVTQVVMLTLLALGLARQRNLLTDEQLRAKLKAIRKIPATLETCLEQSEAIKAIAKKIYKAKSILYMGRGLFYPMALEGALKMKEISYIHAEGYAAGEMKHGPIALIDKKTPVVVLATKGKAYEKIVSNLEEASARKAGIIAICSEKDEALKKMCKHTITLPDYSEELLPLMSAIPLQLLSYHVAVARGCDVDQPRNLAKSVTVE